MKFRKMKIQVILILIALYSIVQAQEIELPDSLFVNLDLVEFSIDDTISQEFYVEYPRGYDSQQEYPIFIGLAGGNQSKDFVMYCYAIYFKTKLLDDYIIVLPIGSDSDGIMSSGKEYYFSLFKVIEDNLPCTPNDWLIAGTSNGGIASLEIVSVQPSRFSGLITMPGIIYGESIEVNANWSHLKALLAYGENDSEGWIQGVQKTNDIFVENSMLTKTLKIPDQGHVFELGFDIDIVYQEYFSLK